MARCSTGLVRVVTALTLGACSAAADSNTDYKDDVVRGMHTTLLGEIESLRTAAQKLQASAPEPAEHGWDAAADADAMAAMRAAWIDARAAYEHIEGAIAPLFPDLDFSIDARYDDFLTKLDGRGDDNAFDDVGVTGMHAIERILWADSIPERVVTFEEALPGYKAAAWPANRDDAEAFKRALCGKLVADVSELHDMWQPQRIDVSGAFQGLIALMREQREKVNKAASNEEESRYSQRTMADIRDNLEGTTNVYGLFRPWLRTKPLGSATDGKIEAGFDELGGTYARVDADAIPMPPATWSAEDPSADDLATPFGELYLSVNQAVDPENSDSIVAYMNSAAEDLGFSAPASEM